MSKCRCDEVEIQISEMILGEVSEETVKKVHEHIAECESCMGFYLSMVETFDDEVDAKEVTGLSQAQRMQIFAEAKRIDAIKKMTDKPPVKKFPWSVILSCAAAVCVSAVIVLPELLTRGEVHVLQEAAGEDLLKAKENEPLSEKSVDAAELNEEVKSRSRGMVLPKIEEGKPPRLKRESSVRLDTRAAERITTGESTVPEFSKSFTGTIPGNGGIRNELKSNSKEDFKYSSDSNGRSGKKELEGTAVPEKLTKTRESEDSKDMDGEVSLGNDGFVDALPPPVFKDKPASGEGLKGGQSLGDPFADDVGLEDISDEVPSTYDDSTTETVSDSVISPFISPAPSVRGGGSAEGRASGGERLGRSISGKEEDGKNLKDNADSMPEDKGLNLLVDSDEELRVVEEEGDKLLAEKKQKPVAKQIPRRQMQETANQPQSTFSIDVDTAGYQIAKTQIANNMRPDVNVLRAEEFINYHNYNYETPNKETFNIQADMTVSPFHKGSNILRVGIQGRRPGGDVRARNNFMFIVDTSGSMADEGRLPLAKKVIPMIVDNMQSGDAISLIAGGLTPRLVLDNVDVSEKDRINREVNSLNAVGATNLEQNLIQGYHLAAMNIAPNTYNRIVLLSDGVANLGEVSAQNILKNLKESKDKGIGLTVVGMGTGDYNDNFLEQLANKGDGNYVFVDDGEEAQKTFENNFAQTFHTIANNVKIQVDFDPKQVARYRLLGYENRRLKNKDFRDDSVDAGEVGSGQSVTAIYEIELTQENSGQPMAMVNMRYKDARDNEMKEQQLKVENRLVSKEFNDSPASLRLAFLSGKYAEVLQQGGNDEGISIEDLLKYMRPLAAELSADPNVQEMLQLMNKSR